MISETKLGGIVKIIVRIAANRLRRAGDAEDVAQDVALVLTQKYSHIEDAREVEKLAKTIMDYKIQNFWAGKGRRQYSSIDDEPHLSDPAPDPEQAAWTDARTQIFIGVLKTIGEPCRTILRMKAEGADVAAIRLATNNQNKENDIFLRINRCVKRAALMVRQQMEVANA